MPQLNCWRARKWSGEFPPGYRWGIWTGRNSVRAPGYYPGPRDRMAIAAGAALEPYWHVMNFTAVEARGTADSQVVPTGDIAIVALMGSITEAAGANTFRSQEYQKTGKDTGFSWSRLPVNNANLWGTGALPFVLRRAYYPPPGQPILGRVISQNAAAAETIQLVLFGLRRRVS